MAKPQDLLLNGKPLDFSDYLPPSTLKIKKFLDEKWEVFSQNDLINKGVFAKDSIRRFQNKFPGYKLEGAYQGRYPIYGSPKALAAYEKARDERAVSR